MDSRNVDEAIDHYSGEGAFKANLDFVATLHEACRSTARLWSPRYAHELNLPGLRSWPLTRFPYLVCYFERGDCVDVWRVLHGQRDIPAWMNES